jgi:hypothetical protein
MTALMSTRPGVHGESVATAVPRETLISALERRTILKRTDKLGGDQAFVAVAAETEGASPFAVVATELLARDSPPCVTAASVSDASTVEP